MTRFTLQRKHHLDVSPGFFAENVFHRFLIRWFVDEARTVFIAVYRFHVFALYDEYAQPFKASNEFLFLFSGFFFEFFNVDVEARRAVTRLGLMHDIRF